MFQYITCYSLSLEKAEVPVFGKRFQYITCYSLSGFTWHYLHCVYVSIHHMLLFIGYDNSNGQGISVFQYITCYSLSTDQSKRFIMLTSFNTSHVTLYLTHNSQDHTSYIRFNTSHVTLYPSFYRDFIHPHV